MHCMSEDMDIRMWIFEEYGVVAALQIFFLVSLLDSG